MSATVKLAARLPGDHETNGLDAYAAHLLDYPDEPMIAVVWLDAQKVTIDTDSGAHVPTARVRRIEVVSTDVDKVPAALVDLVSGAMEKRTGRKAIPFGMVEVEEGYDPDQFSIGDDQ